MSENDGMASLKSLTVTLVRIIVRLLQTDDGMIAQRLCSFDPCLGFSYRLYLEPD
jgi:hypothetical protein